jgi:hypothetical protein
VDNERERASEGAPVTKARENFNLVTLDLLTGTAAVALLASVKVGVDRGLVEHEPGRQPGHDRDERRAV